jgi:hypothetical protein
MAEGAGWTGDVLQYLCIARPLLFFSYPKDPVETEDMFQNCLLAGATCYTAPGAAPPSETTQLFEAYLPLLKWLHGREWLLEANPLELPREVEGNVFRNPDGDVLVTLVSARARIRDVNRDEKPVSFELNIRDADRIQEAEYLSPLQGGSRAAEVKAVGSALRVRLPDHRVASVVRLHG